MVVTPRARRAGLFSYAAECRVRAGPGRLSHGQSAAGDSSGSDGTQGGHISAEPRINERIRVPEVRLVGPAGEQVGIVSIDDALRLAQEADLDLVEVAPTARPPVCKLMDYGKFKYESALKARESRKNQTQTVIKEIKLRPKIDPHDYGTKKGHVERFLKAGDKVKVTIMFRGREQSRPELGFRLLQRLAGDVDELGFVEAQPKQDGRNMTMVIGPHRRKSDAKADRPVHQQAERSHPERPERSPQTERGPRTQPVQAQPAEAQPAEAQPAEAQPVQAQPVQAQPVQAQPVQAQPVQAQPVQVQPADAQPVQAQPVRAQPAEAQPVQAQPAGAQPAQAQPAQGAPAQAQPAQAKPAQAKPAAPRPAAPRPAAPRPAAARPTPPPADRAPARPVPGPRAVHAAAASAARRAANNEQETQQPGQEVSAN